MMNQSKKAILTCANWLAYCLKIGWSRHDLDRLEWLWWKYHDDHGRLLMGPGIKPRYDAPLPVCAAKEMRDPGQQPRYP